MAGAHESGSSDESGLGDHEPSHGKGMQGKQKQKQNSSYQIWTTPPSAASANLFSGAYSLRSFSLLPKFVK